MKLVKMTDGKVGLFVSLPKGPYAIDIINSLGVFVPHDPLSNGLLNGVLKDGCNWYLIVNHWAHLRWPLKKLASTATANPDHPRLVLQPITDDLRLGNAADPIVAIEITELESFEERNSTDRRTVERPFMLPPDNELLQDATTVTETAQIINFCPSNRGNAPRR
jgi:hypothetical protein